MTRRATKLGRRIALRLPRLQKRHINRAAAMAGKSTNAFILEAIAHSARSSVCEQNDSPETGFSVLCRIDAYADYVANVDADDVEEAAWLARDNHGDYVWRSAGVQEFDDRLYVTLDLDGNEISETQIGDF